MGRLIKAEFRKTLTTKLWWGLMIPTVIVAFGWALGASALATRLFDALGREAVFQQAGIDVNSLSWSALAFTHAINFGTIFPMVFGALAVAGELNRKTITTSFLTAPNRISLFSAKIVTYAAWGAIYGLVIVSASSIGVLLGSGPNHLMEAGAWIAIAAAGVATCMLWTLLGLGVGALIGSSAGSLVLLLFYSLVIGPWIEPLLSFLVRGNADLAAWSPNGSGNGLTGSTAGDVLASQIQDMASGAGGGVIPPRIMEPFEESVRALAGAPGAVALWASGLAFLGWTALMLGGGLYRTNTRDIT